MKYVIEQKKVRKGGITFKGYRYTSKKLRGLGGCTVTVLACTTSLCNTRIEIYDNSDFVDPVCVFASQDKKDLFPKVKVQGNCVVIDGGVYYHDILGRFSGQVVRCCPGPKFSYRMLFEDMERNPICAARLLEVVK